MKLQLKKLFINACLIVIITYSLIFFFLSEAWRVSFVSDINQIKEEVTNGIDYSENYSKVIDIIRPSEINMKKLYHRKVFSVLSGIPQMKIFKTYGYLSSDVLYIIHENYQKSTDIQRFFQEIIFAFGLEKKLTAKEIEAYYFLNKNINVQLEDGKSLIVKGINEAAQVKFDKTIEELSTEELVKIYILFSPGSEYYQNNHEAYQHRTDFLLFLLDKEN